jgi:hypothetical protein
MMGMCTLAAKPEVQIHDKLLTSALLLQLAKLGESCSYAKVQNSHLFRVDLVLLLWACGINLKVKKQTQLIWQIATAPGSPLRRR